VEFVPVSQQYRVTIPVHVRRALGIKPGQKMHIFVYDNRIELIPVNPIGRARGFLKGMDTAIEREEDRI
jgi:AbrB family looped-hinge helix DNA binding protein